MGKNSLKNIINEQEYNDIVQMYQNNISLREIERITHHGRNAISKMLEEDGIKTTKGNHYRKYFFNENFFEKVDNELAAYWLGFLYADGSISSHNGAYIVNIVGTESFIKELYNFFNMGSTIFPDKRKENSWYLSIGGNYQVIKVYHLLYDNSTRYMERKYLKFKELITKYDESQGA